MIFKEMKDLMKFNFARITSDVDTLFEVDVDKDLMWDTYLGSFPKGTNNLFRKRNENDCSCCRQFIRNFGNVVAIKDGVVKNIWDFKTNDTTWQPVLDALSNMIKEAIVSDIYVSKLAKIGTDRNLERLENGEVLSWEHFHVQLPEKFVTKSSDSEGSIKGRIRSRKDVFKRSLDEITEDSVMTVLELIGQGSLVRGDEWKKALTDFLKLKREYMKVAEDKKNLYAWEKSLVVGDFIGRIRNHAIGTLLVNLSEEMELNLAVKKYVKIMDPENYQRVKTVYTQRMLENAQKRIIEMGYMPSLGRRYATIDDITVNNILFANRDVATKQNLDVFGEMAKEVCVNPKQFDKVQEITIEDFINGVLPTANSIEVLVENKHTNNLMSLIAPKEKDSKTMFKWDNGFSWAYNNNLADSSMRENVAKAGGKVDGVLRFSIQWNEKDENQTDLDAHCIEPCGNEIYFSSKTSRTSGGQLDVDIVSPRGVAVENITWADTGRMREGTYKFFVHQFSGRGGRFTAEIEVDGIVHSFEYPKVMSSKENVQVAEVVYNRATGFRVIDKLQGSSVATSKKAWNLDTNNFQPVTVLMKSPNYWNEQTGIGNKHYFFMLSDCINEESPNGFFNEYLKSELREDRKVFEALGSKMAVEDSNDQLSGLGFSSTRRAELVVRVKGATSRMLKIKF